MDLSGPIGLANSLDALSERLLGNLRSAGAVAAGITSAEGFEGDLTFLQRQRASGENDTMAFTYRNPYRSTHIRVTYPYAKSIVVAAHRYEKPLEPEVDYVAAYSLSDYYAELRSMLYDASRLLKDNGYRAQVVMDSNALVDKAAARRAGLGWVGKNSLVLIPKVGSNVVLGSIVTDAELCFTDSPVRSLCGSCTRCQDNCPTGALQQAGVVDVSRCLAWLLQREGSFPLTYRETVGTQIYGCDRCQTVCPVGGRARRDSKSQLEPAESSFEPKTLLVLTDEELLRRCERFYVPSRSANHIRRNALLALGNKRPITDQEVELLRRYSRSPDPVLAEQALWSLARHGLALSYT
ncbi:epoxyqueuosine reductase [Ferrithrix thermotolerans DSM 19514]|uniref:Epoxyqueuosine reductase n=1 Tax=Ferrithrix thermotolerans DSM 19514 TaxID=1121881 RepID=A0A1M4UN46_9ACTN|nr:tRNA epoxyqueuosine(34) reductase QueG [Ferrithrix thermotolerans]SHE58114.1 epoxyqueuosine reductase [Ferrithrix thermotolerans DSM 19514]